MIYLPHQPRDMCFSGETCNLCDEQYETFAVRIYFTGRPEFRVNDRIKNA